MSLGDDLERLMRMPVAEIIPRRDILERAMQERFRAGCEYMREAIEAAFQKGVHGHILVRDIEVDQDISVCTLCGGAEDEHQEDCPILKIRALAIPEQPE